MTSASCSISIPYYQCAYFDLLGGAEPSNAGHVIAPLSLLLQINLMIDTVANRYTIQITGVNAFQAPDIEPIHSGVRARLVVGVDAAV
ncbi:hypothetical protein HALO59_80097 [Halomonas sp. 59]|nr:hypothetical protein HALOI3_100097 [Halomonas sp. I3]CAD5254860.1 hypothetical protein HALO156_120122 [Halomonas sp. 156]CAD5294248.1 hypothetical protein HALO113_90213 [Halomonas sp. 113]CAD5295527.1 hypothetical protein HALO59_80097 [Halomonas sp. 59]VXB83210.1 hypothetical protein HALO153_200100 [Halomonas titanicae]